MAGPREHRAFTLIELLVVISIIALLVGILVPTLGKAKETARRAKCLANLKGMGVGFALYMNESDGIMPNVLPLQSDDNGNDASLLDVLVQYVDAPKPVRPEGERFYTSNDPFICPSDRSSDDADADFEPAWRSFGTSYEYWPGALIVYAEALVIARPVFAVSKLYEIWDWPLLADADEWHARSGGVGGNALMAGDYRADWFPEITDDDRRRFFEDLLRYRDMNP